MCSRTYGGVFHRTSRSTQREDEVIPTISTCVLTNITICPEDLSVCPEDNRIYPEGSECVPGHIEACPKDIKVCLQWYLSYPIRP